ncbi:hypothetical protein CN535_27085 [Bacillus pseudomycoides]|nr:hypothetical protein bpmyx0001_52860 [Bacillus pseudomycoides DSM 12442]PEU33274.1 hypothetical protein CN535_27085 [Bacillus pseudomycoides]
MFYNTYYNKTVPKGIYFLETFQKCIFEVLERIFHVILIVPKGVPFDTKNPHEIIVNLYYFSILYL